MYSEAAAAVEEFGGRVRIEGGELAETVWERE